jgi:hypothetical protein
VLIVGSNDLPRDSASTRSGYFIEVLPRVRTAHRTIADEISEEATQARKIGEVVGDQGKGARWKGTSLGRAGGSWSTGSGAGARHFFTPGCPRPRLITYVLKGQDSRL